MGASTWTRRAGEGPAAGGALASSGPPAGPRAEEAAPASRTGAPPPDATEAAGVRCAEPWRRRRRGGERLSLIHI
eukprot:4947752-Alexandrium_andersonii.AAC.1